MKLNTTPVVHAALQCKEQEAQGYKQKALTI